MRRCSCDNQSSVRARSGIGESNNVPNPKIAEMPILLVRLMLSLRIKQAGRDKMQMSRAMSVTEAAV